MVMPSGGMTKLSGSLSSFWNCGQKETMADASPPMPPETVNGLRTEATPGVCWSCWP